MLARAGADKSFPLWLRAIAEECASPEYVTASQETFDLNPG